MFTFAVKVLWHFYNLLRGIIAWHLHFALYLLFTLLPFSFVNLKLIASDHTKPNDLDSDNDHYRDIPIAYY